MTSQVAFVTGATGLLGSNLCRALRAQGWQVKGLVRSPEKAKKFLNDTGTEYIQGDMLNVPAFADALSGVDVVFHTAAFFREYYQPGFSWDTMKRINVDGTMELLRAAEKQGVKRTVFTSSSGVIQTSRHYAATEAAEYNVYAQKNLYFKTKVLAEKEIFRFLEHSQMEVVMILPGWMMGPGDAAPTSAGRLVIDLLNRKIPGVIDGGSSLVDARDVASAMISAAKVGQNGARYIVTGPLATMMDISSCLEKVSGMKTPQFILPSWLALSLAWLSEVWVKISGGANSMPLEGVRTLLEKATLSSAKAEKELGATFRPLEHTIKDTMAWYQAHNYL